MVKELAKCNILGVVPPDIVRYAESGNSPCDVDLEEIRRCQALYSNLWMLSAGTIVEMYVAKYEVGIPVITLCRIHNPSPWIAFCTTHFAKSRKEAIDILTNLREKCYN